MTKKFNMIKDIDEKKETLKLAVRIKDTWFVQPWCQSSHEVNCFGSEGKWIVLLCMFDEMWKICVEFKLLLWLLLC